MHIEKKKFVEFREDRGCLIPIEFRDLPFIPKRVFYVTGVPKDSRRGEHAHFLTEQLLICVQGRVGVNLLFDTKQQYLVLEENEYVYVPNFYWDAQDFLTGNDVLLVLCSTEYDKSDYINDLLEYHSLWQ